MRESRERRTSERNRTFRKTIRMNRRTQYTSYLVSMATRSDSAVCIYVYMSRYCSIVISNNTGIGDDNVVVVIIIIIIKGITQIKDDINAGIGDDNDVVVIRIIIIIKVITQIKDDINDTKVIIIMVVIMIMVKKKDSIFFPIF